LDSLANFATRHEQFDPEPVRRPYEQTFVRTLSVYLDKKGKPDTFWRATLEMDFLWGPKPKNQESV